MFTSVSVSAVLFGLCVAALPQRAGAATAIGTEFRNGRLWDIDLATGVKTNPRETGIPALGGLAFTPDGTLYGLSMSEDFDFAQRLWRIEPATGNRTLVGRLGGWAQEGDLAAQPGTGALFAVGVYVPGGPSSNTLARIDRASGAASLVGPILPENAPDVDFSAMAFAPDGTLYVLNTGQGVAGPDVEQLLRVDAANGQVLSTITLTRDDGLPVSLGGVAGFAFDASTGVAYIAEGENGITDRLYRVVPATGVLSVVGTIESPGVASLAIIPEPAAPLGLALSLALLARRRAGRVI